MYVLSTFCPKRQLFVCGGSKCISCHRRDVLPVRTSSLDDLVNESRSTPRRVEEPVLRKGTREHLVNNTRVHTPSPPVPNAQEAKNPTRLPFEPMYQQLAAWQSQHCSCHVPRNCFDAPPLLDAWVRYLRRKHAAGKLEQWKVDRLNLLGFEWVMGDVQAKWINMYHQLRRFKAVHGHTRVPPDYRNSEEPGWEILARWLRRQAQLFAKAKLSQQQQDMLARVGVALEVPAYKLEQYTQLQGLNAHERKKLRRAWRDQRRQRWQGYPNQQRNLWKQHQQQQQHNQSRQGQQHQQQ